MRGIKQKCPLCGSSDIVPILYGLPTEKALEAAEKGKIELGGCVTRDGDPQFCCRACRWDDRRQWL